MRALGVRMLRNRLIPSEGIDRRLRSTQHGAVRSARESVLGRLTVDRLLAILAWHDDNHLDQLGRALAGRA